MKPRLFFLLLLLSTVAAAQQRYDVLMTEIMADPSPQVGLPNCEYVELKNTSNKDLDLSGWRLSSTSTSGAFPLFVLKKDSFVVLCATSNAVQLSQFGRTIGIPSFPSLANDGALLSLTSKDGKTIHAVDYSNTWFNNAAKQDGGWSLEMIDTKNPCNGQDNWQASIDLKGGTPGRKNSVDAINPDVSPPELLRSYSSDSVTIIAVFNEPLDSASAAVISNYSLTDNSITAASPKGPLFTTVILHLLIPMQKRTAYDLKVHSVTDCAGNGIGAYNSTPAGLGEDALANDIVINEILFDPKPNAFDWLEIYNRSEKIIDANRLYLGNRSAGNISPIKKLSESPFFIFPNEYIVITENLASLQLNYLVKQPQKVLMLSSLPSFPDDKGDVVLMNIAGDVLDEVAYEDDWHFPLLTEVEGVSLERIDPASETQNKNNWHSAAATAGYGTPTYQNSQFKRVDDLNVGVNLSPQIFSPDNDGHDDVATISLQLSEAGYIANISIFDAAGHMARYLVKNELLAFKNTWNWDGLGEKMQRLPVGVYVVYTEIFNLQGKKKRFKNPVVLARKTN